MVDDDEEDGGEMILKGWRGPLLEGVKPKTRLRSFFLLVTGRRMQRMTIGNGPCVGGSLVGPKVATDSASSF
jgi:hypothetical protein